MILTGNKEVKNLRVIETVDSEKLAGKIDSALKDEGRTMQVFVQVNTSGEEKKSGVDPSKLLDLVKKIKSDFTRLKLKGIMTIGELGGDGTADFKV